jgi:hypothetical protein
MPWNSDDWATTPIDTLSDEVLREVAGKFWKLSPAQVSDEYIAKLRRDRIEWNMIAAPAPTRHPV